MAEEIRLDDCLSIRGGHLFVEDCDATALAERYATPLYVVSEDHLRRNIRRLAASFRAGWPHGPVRVLPSIKASFLLALRWILSQEGAGCDAFGGAELEAALRGGTSPGLISVNGPKDQATIDRAVAVGAKVTLDGAGELEMVRRAAQRAGRTAVVRPRLRPDLTSLTQPSDWWEDTVPVHRVAQVYKAGIPREDALALGQDLLGTPGIDVSGVHVHVGRHRSEPDYWRQVVREIVALLGEIREAWRGWAPREIDLGGGLPIPRDPFGRGIERVAARPADVPPLEEFADAITGSLRDELRIHGFDPDGIALEVEPGRALYGDAGVHLATIRGMKQQTEPFPWTWVETDTTENFLPDAIFEHNRWSVIVANRADAEPTMRGDLVGCSCNPDRIVPEADLPAVEPGDIVAILDTGAYQEALASNFNLLLRPATVLVTGDRSEVIKRRETLQDLLSRDVVPDRLHLIPDPNGRETPAGHRSERTERRA
jgi:diaminopimelate decarboxylase